jgi:hypothetical protein
MQPYTHLLARARRDPPWLPVIYLVIFLVIFLLASLVIPASAQTTCGPIEAIHTALTDQYGLQFQDSRADPSAPGGVAELWINHQTGAFAVLVYPQSGVACLVHTGQSDKLISYAA